MPEYEIPGRAPIVGVSSSFGDGEKGGKDDIKKPRGFTPRPPYTPIVTNAGRPSARTTQQFAQTAAQRKITINAANGVIEPLYGRTRSAGKIVYWKESGGYFYVVFDIGWGELEEVFRTRLDGKLPADVSATVNTYLGAPGQIVDPLLAAIDSNWVSRRPMRAYAVVKHTPPTSETGQFDPLKFSCELKGRKVWDPRASGGAGARIYSENAALCTADFMTDKTFGGGIRTLVNGDSVEEMDWVSIAYAADVCDQILTATLATPTVPPTAVRVPGGGSLNGTFNGNYSYLYTWENAAGLESEGSPASAGIATNVNDSMDLIVSNGPAGTVAKNIYRTKADGLGPYKFLHRIPDNTTTTYSDTKADSALGRSVRIGPLRRYTMGGGILRQGTLASMIEMLRAHFACYVTWTDGKFRFVVDAPRAIALDPDTSEELHFSDAGDERTVVGIPKVRSRGLDEVPTRVSGNFIDAENDFQDGHEKDEALGITSLAEDVREETFEFPLCNNSNQVRRLCRLGRKRKLLSDEEFTIDVMSDGAIPLPYDLVKFTSEFAGEFERPVTILDIERTGIGWSALAENYDEDAYDDLVEVITTPVQPQGPDPNATPPNVSGLTAPTTTEALIGTVYWTDPVFPNILGFEVYDNRVSPASFIRLIPLGQSPTPSVPLDLKQYVFTNPDGSRSFAVKVVTVTAANKRSSGATVAWTLSSTLPPRDSTIYNINGGHIYKTGTGWAAVRSAASGTAVENDVAQLRVDADLEATPGDFTIFRPHLEFDTAGVLAGRTVSSARLGLFPKLYYPSRATTVHVVASTANPAPYDVGDYSAVGSVSFGSRAFSNLDNDRYVEIELNAAGIAALNDGGLTKFALRVDQDLNDAEPASPYLADLHFIGTELVANGARLVITYTSEEEDDEEAADGFAIDEVASGVVDGVNATFQLLHATPIGTVFGFDGPAKITEGCQFTRAGNVITFGADWIPRSGRQPPRFTYRYVPE